MNWRTVTLEDGRQRHHANTETRRLSVYDWKNGRVDFAVYDQTGNNLISQGKCSSVEEAKKSAENVA